MGGNKSFLNDIALGFQKGLKNPWPFKGYMLKAERRFHSRGKYMRGGDNKKGEGRLGGGMFIFHIDTLDEMPETEGIHFFFFGDLERRAIEYVLEG